MLTNTATRYGAAARFFHWSIALLILIDIALGLWGKFTPRNSETVDFLQTLYSSHKTIGMAVLALAVLRVIWAFLQPRPVALHPERRLESFAAETAHWLLYAAIFILPLSGWVMHSAEVGFAPIWWPFGQNLPFIPKSEQIAHWAANLHWLAGLVLAATIAAHISGALKHAWFDHDATLARMWRGADAGDAGQKSGKHAAPAMAALLVWALVIGGALTVFAPTNEEATLAQSAPLPASGWVVEEGDLSITVTQLGAPVSGRFDIWQAGIEYDPATGAGQVEVVIDTGSLSLGSVTDQATGPEFFDVAQFAQAVFEAEITRIEGAAHSATGTLTLVGQVVPVTLAFDLDLQDGSATMSGRTQLDRRDFGMGADYPDESSVGFSVGVEVSLTAAQTE